MLMNEARITVRERVAAELVVRVLIHHVLLPFQFSSCHRW
jgi:hypothetical protein